jgi:hypothetical protein
MFFAANKKSNDDFFQQVSDFFHSDAWAVVRDSLVVLGFVFWLAAAYWVFKDARRRIANPFLVGLTTLLGLVPPFLGVLIYLLFRPPEYLDEVRERELEIKAIEESLALHELRCPVCRAHVGESFLVCPVCTTRLKQACTTCKAPLEPLWQVCPYCETRIESPSTFDVEPLIEQPRRSTPRTSD